MNIFYLSEDYRYSNLYINLKTDYNGLHIKQKNDLSPFSDIGRFYFYDENCFFMIKEKSLNYKKSKMNFKNLIKI